MKLATMLGTILFASSVSAQTVINYEDGSTYTLKDNEEVYVTSIKVWSVNGSYSKGYFNIRPVKANSKRDYVTPEPDPDSVDPETGLPYCDTIPGWPMTFGGYTPCTVRPAESDEDTGSCDAGGLSFGGSC